MIESKSESLAHAPQHERLCSFAAQYTFRLCINNQVRETSF